MSLTATEYKRAFFMSTDAADIRHELEKMTADPGYNTQSFYTPLQLDNLSFVDKHLNYLSDHPKLKASEYLANLRLMTKKR